MAHHILIAGPGRSGTTVLVKLLAQLGFETGGKLRPFSDAANAGLEDDILDPSAPYVVKNPDLSWQLGVFLADGCVMRENIDWLVIPMRQLDEAAASRIRTTAATRDLNAPGGMVRTRRPGKQREQLAAVTYDLLRTAALFELPLIVIEYPRFARDPRYAFRRLRPMLAGHDEERFLDAWKAVVDPGLVRTAPIKVSRHVGMRVAVLRLRRFLRNRFT